VYCTSVQKLIAIPIWEQQRIYRPERAQLLAQDIKAKLSEGRPLTLPGVRRNERLFVCLFVCLFACLFVWAMAPFLFFPSCWC